MSQFKIEGADLAIKRLDELAGRGARNSARRALRQGANVVLRAARENAKRLDDPSTPENIAKNITVRGGGARRERREGGVMMRVGVRGGAQIKKGVGTPPGGDTWYWRMLELGTEKMAARPFMRPALQNNSQAAIDMFARTLGTEIDKELAKVK